MKNFPRILALLVSLAFVGAGCVGPVAEVPSPAPTPGIAEPAPPIAAPPLPVEKPKDLSEPIGNALQRVTKKNFGLKVSPKDSPVSPERFSGYHTGVDFETTPDEQSVDIPIKAACDGTLALKEFASGYGGVAVERCKLDGADVTVIYGHLRLSSIFTKTGSELKSGETFGVLGTGYSKETDGERKHLHFGIHKGTSIDIKGYVQTKAELAGWIDAMSWLQ